MATPGTLPRPHTQNHELLLQRPPKESGASGNFLPRHHIKQAKRVGGVVLSRPRGPRLDRNRCCAADVARPADFTYLDVMRSLIRL
jgi:hypothetical protein